MYLYFYSILFQVYKSQYYVDLEKTLIIKKLKLIILYNIFH